MVSLFSVISSETAETSRGKMEVMIKTVRGGTVCKREPLKYAERIPVNPHDDTMR